MAGRGAVVAAGIVASLTIALGAVAPVRAVDPDPKPTRIKVRVSAAEVVVLQPVTIQGRVSGHERRVELELRDAYEWRRIDKTRTDELGRYMFAAPTDWYGKKRLRVVAPATKTHEAAKARVSVRVTPGYAPLGSKDSWNRLNRGVKSRYDPCEKVAYAVNPALLPADGIAVLNEAIFRVELATGLRYKYVGTTSAIPFRSTPGRENDKDANLVVAWSTPETDAATLEGNLGVGGVLRSQWVSERRTYERTKTGILLNAGSSYTYRGFENAAALGGVHMAILAFALGLGIVNDPTQLMYKYALSTAPALFGNGDLAGLKEHGRDAGCLDEDDEQARRAGRLSSPLGLGVRGRD